MKGLFQKILSFKSHLVFSNRTCKINTQQNYLNAKWNCLHAKNIETFHSSVLNNVRNNAFILFWSSVLMLFMAEISFSPCCFYFCALSDWLKLDVKQSHRWPLTKICLVYIIECNLWRSNFVFWANKSIYFHQINSIK